MKKIMYYVSIIGFLVSCTEQGNMSETTTIEKNQFFTVPSSEKEISTSITEETGIDQEISGVIFKVQKGQFLEASLKEYSYSKKELENATYEYMILGNSKELIALLNKEGIKTYRYTHSFYVKDESMVSKVSSHLNAQGITYTTGHNFKDFDVVFAYVRRGYDCHTNGTTGDCCTGFLCSVFSGLPSCNSVVRNCASVTIRTKPAHQQ